MIKKIMTSIKSMMTRKETVDSLGFLQAYDQKLSADAAMYAEEMLATHDALIPGLDASHRAGYWSGCYQGFVAGYMARKEDEKAGL